MSADSWSKCPLCLKEKKEKHKRDLIQLKNSYGKIPADEYYAKRTKLAISSELDTSFRENYEFDLNSEAGELKITYTGYCSVCKFKYELRKVIDILDKKI